MGAQLCKLYVTTGKCGYSIHLPSTSISSEYQQQGDRWLLELECGVVDAEFSVSSHCPHQLTMSLYPQWQTCSKPCLTMFGMESASTNVPAVGEQIKNKTIILILRRKDK